MEERWLPCIEFPTYEISCSGRLRRGIRILRPSLCAKGYVKYSVSVDGNGYCRTAHRLLYEAFVGPIPPEQFINHKDGVKTNNLLTNLELVTSSGNMKHARRLGLQKYPKLTPEKIKNIRGRPQDKTLTLAKEFNVTTSHIRRIRAFSAWLPRNHGDLL